MTDKDKLRGLLKEIEENKKDKKWKIMIPLVAISIIIVDRLIHYIIFGKWI